MEGAGDRLGRLLRLVDFDHQLGHIRQEARVVLLLQRQPAEIPALDLSDQHHDGGGVVIGRVQGDHRVRQPGPARDQGHAGAVAQPAVGHRHKAGPALVTADDHTDRVLFNQRAGQSDIALARHAIDLVDIMRFEAFGQQAGDGLGHVQVFLFAIEPVGYRKSMNRKRRNRVRSLPSALAGGPIRSRLCVRQSHSGRTKLVVSLTNF